MTNTSALTKWPENMWFQCLGMSWLLNKWVIESRGFEHDPPVLWGFNRTSASRKHARGAAGVKEPSQNFISTDFKHKEPQQLGHLNFLLMYLVLIVSRKQISEANSSQMGTEIVQAMLLLTDSLSCQGQMTQGLDISPAGS